MGFELGWSFKPQKEVIINATYLPLNKTKTNKTENWIPVYPPSSEEEESNSVDIIDVGW